MIGILGTEFTVSERY